MQNNYNFFAMVNRMKYIDRWALMPNANKEILQSIAIALLLLPMLLHLSVIGNSAKL